jgi:hypothetical protein
MPHGSAYGSASGSVPQPRNAVFTSRYYEPAVWTEGDGVPELGFPILAGRQESSTIGAECDGMNGRARRTHFAPRPARMRVQEPHGTIVAAAQQRFAVRTEGQGTHTPERVRSADPLSCSCFAKLEDAVTAHCHGFSARVESNVLNESGMFKPPADRVACRCLPELGGSIMASRQDRFAVRTERHRPNAVLMSGELPEFFPRC